MYPNVNKTASLTTYLYMCIYIFKIKSQVQNLFKVFRLKIVSGNLVGRKSYRIGTIHTTGAFQTTALEALSSDPRRPFYLLKKREFSLSCQRQPQLAWTLRFTANKIEACSSAFVFQPVATFQNFIRCFFYFCSHSII